MSSHWEKLLINCRKYYEEKVAKLEMERNALKKELAEATRKGQELCHVYGMQLMQLHDLTPVINAYCSEYPDDPMVVTLRKRYGLGEGGK